MPIYIVDYDGSYLGGRAVVIANNKDEAVEFVKNDNNTVNFEDVEVTMVDKDIGACPVVEGKRFSVDRIDNTKGYMRGNIRWADDSEQAKNQGMYKNNKTGVKGVYYNRHLHGYTCTWRDLHGKAKAKSFSIGKYGEELALFLAQEYRITMMERLNLLGAGYSHYHLYGEVEEEA